MKWSVLINAALVLALVVSALAVVHTVYRNRTLFAELQQLRQQRDQLNVEWGQLQLEESTWATHARIQQVAREKLDMHMPRKIQRVVVKP
ncbi:MAG TPA: cell division protein FtsL [Gammaproteobacteria bacterium]|nr:cell division protein FtsL [Gammaproteobacteria bacterium]HET7586613.1 cell division protein FtsL [Gammaproteobacteria bacterium]